MTARRDVSRKRRVWQWIGENHEQLAIAVSIIAALFVWYEYHSSQVDADIKRSMDFQARFSDKEVLRARVALDNFLFDPKFEANRKATGLQGNDAIEKLALDAHLDPSVRLLADFYGQVATCMKNSLCDIETACASFREPAKELRDNFYGLFRDWEKTWKVNLIEGTHKYFETECENYAHSFTAKLPRWLR